MRKVVIVDAQDKPIGLKPYEAVVYEDIYRVAALWVTDEQSGDVLIAQRKWNKRNDPGKWSAAVAGTIEEGETYEENIVHETAEEIGLRGIEFTKGPKQFVDDGKHKFFCQWFYAKIDKNTATITIQEEEVEGVKWIPVQDLIKSVATNPNLYTPSTTSTLETLGLIQTQQ